MDREYIVKMSTDEATSLSMEYFQHPTLVDREKEFRNRFMKKVFNYCDSREDYACEKRIRLSKSEDTKYRMVRENTRNYTSGLDMNSSNVSMTDNGNILKNDFTKNRNFSSWSDLDVPGYSNLNARVSVGSLTNGHDHERSQTNDNDYFDRRRLYSQRPEVTKTLSFNEELRSSGSNQVKWGYPYMSQYDVKMATEEEVAMNLSTEGKYSSDIGTSLTNSPSSVANGDIETHSQGQASPLADAKGTGSAGSSKRKSRSTEEPSSDLLDTLGSLSQHQSLLMLAAQHGLSPQQLQQMMISQQGASMPPHVQQLLQAQQSVVMQQQQKVQEQALVQLNEQLQLNLLQQSQLVLEKKTNGKQTQQQLQQLALQQQQIVQQIQQIQLQQRQLLLACLMQPFSTQQGVMSSVDMHQAWKDMTASQGSNDDPLKSMVTNGTSLGALNGTSLGMNHLLQGSMLGANGITAEAFSLGHMIGQPAVTLKTEDGLNPLFRHGVCKWPGCDTECSDLTAFSKHLVNEHTLDDKNTAQARVQMQIVSQLEIQLTREKELLHAMMQHLHTQPQRKNHELTEHKVSEKNTTSPKMSSSIVSPMKSSTGNNSLPVPTPKKQSTLSHMSPVSSGLAPLVIPPQPGLTSIPSCPGSLQSQSQPTTPTGGLGPMRRRVSDKCNLPISAEIQRNRDFYKSTDVRPPFTYASLIRQAIIESENKQLTLNEVYQWFQNTFAYFRRNEATWKNAVRHNLSLHKCFMRVENVKGAVWTVDEVEFYKRRPQKLTGAISSSASFSSDTGIYGDPINASIRAAMEQNPILFSQHMSNGGMSDNGVEDLSMKSYNNSNDSFIKSESPQRDGPGYSEMDLMNYRDESLNNSPRDYTCSNQGLDLSPKTSSNGSPKSLLPNSIGSDRASPQSRNITSEGVLNETANGQFVSDMEYAGHHREHYSDSKGSVIKQESHDMQMRSADDQSEALNMKVEPKVEIDRKSHDVLEVQKLYSEERDNDYASYSTSGGASLYQRESPIDQRHSDQNIHSSYHNNAMVSVSHSMT